MQPEPSTRTPPYPDSLPSAGIGLVIAALFTGAVGMLLQLGVGLSPTFALKCVALFPALALLVAGSMKERAHLGPADLITLFRAMITALVIGFVGEARASDLPTWLCFGAGLAFVLDAIDGWVARRTGSASSFGALLDMELDGLTVFGLGALLWWLDRTGLWVLSAGTFRYLFIAASWFFPWMKAPLYPTKRRAWMCGVQLTTAIFALLAWPAPWMSPLLAGIGLFALIGSFATDVLWLYRNRP